MSLRFCAKVVLRVLVPRDKTTVVSTSNSFTGFLLVPDEHEFSRLPRLWIINIVYLLGQITEFRLDPGVDVTISFGYSEI